jgi:hypothetical protein
MSVPVFLTNNEGGFVEVIDGAVKVSGEIVSQPQLDSGSIDAFGRARVSTPAALFDSKLISDERTELWDNQETSGSGTSTTYNANRSDLKMSTTANTAGTRVRQTFRHFNYYAAKSQLIFVTMSAMGTSTGMAKRAGYFDDSDGLFFESIEGVLNFVVRSNVSATPVDTKYTQASWNIDKLDGNGASGYTLDPDKGNILVIDFEWLGVGRVRFGFVIDGKLIYCHAINNANSVDSVYMSTPTLPVRHEIANDGNGVADLFMYQICSSVSAEGGQDRIGFPRSYAMDTIESLTGTANTWAMLGIRLKAGHLHTDVRLSSLRALTTAANSGMLVSVHVNPTINGTPSWADVTGTAVQAFTGNGSTLDITSPGGLVYQFPVYAKSADIAIPTSDLGPLGSYIDGTPTELVIGMKAFSAGAGVNTALNWREH